MSRPTDGVSVKRDRARPGSRHNSETVVVAFRVHYRNTHDLVHRVTDEMWEHEAVAFADRAEAFPGMELIESPDRPRGIESILGWDRVSNGTVFSDNYSDDFWAAKAQALGRAVRDARENGDHDETMNKMSELVELLGDIQSERLRTLILNAANAEMGAQS